VQIPRAAVVTQALPKLEDIGLGGAREVLYSGIGVQKAVPIADSLLNAGLLHDDFTEPNPIRLGVFSPRQVPLIF
jgi:hypothetical protein